MGFGDKQLQHLVTAGACGDRSVRIWARSAASGRHLLRFGRRGEPGTTAEVAVDLDPKHHDGTGAWPFGPDTDPPVAFDADTDYAVELWHAGAPLCTATFRTAPAPGAAMPRRWSFGALSCHQPFGKDGEITPEARSMLAAATQAYQTADVRFVLLMGDQTYADLPEGYSLFDDEHFARVAPEGRARLLDCTAGEIHRLYQERHRIFWACEEFARLQSSFACYSMPDDHEIVDNFGSDPTHIGPRWEALRAGALDAFFDYQGARALPRGRDGSRPDSLDWGFAFGTAAVWGMDIRSHRRTSDDETTAYASHQFEALERFLVAHVDRKLLVVMSPIPLVHIDSTMVRLAGALVGKGSDLHERWSHPQCLRDRDRLFMLLQAQSHRSPQQRIILLSGDVHAGAAFEIDFEDGTQLVQMTSSAVSNCEGWLVAKACEQAAQTVDGIELVSGSRATVGLIRGATSEASANPFGGLNVGIVDVYEHHDRAGVGFRLIGHDGNGGPKTVFDSGELGLRSDPDRRLSG